MSKKRFIILPIFILLPLLFTWQVKAQNANAPYDVRFFPDIWYNSVDAARIGVDVRGGQAGNTAFGYHRLNLGVWLATRFPKVPLSYYMDFTEPIDSWSDFNAESSIGIVSEYRAGYTQHGLELNKRWQVGFDEDKYDLFHFKVFGEKLYTTNYELFSGLWDTDWHFLADLDFSIRRISQHRSTYLALKTRVSPGISGKSFAQGTLEFAQKFTLGSGFQWNYRLFGALSSTDTPVQYQYLYSMSSPHDWKGNPFMRGRGTVPPVWMREGWVQLAGGPAIRGYLSQDIYNLKTNAPHLMRNITSVNTELTYPNPISQLLAKHSFINNFLSFRSYLFADAGGTFKQKTALNTSNIVVSDGRDFRGDAGPGFALSITFPDNEGRTKTITFRYDVPLWLSDPMDGSSPFKYRNIFGLNAIIPFK